MGKRNYEWSETKYKKFISEGRGQSEGAEYIPWNKIEDYPSNGRVSRVFGSKTKRIHHFFSDLQTRYFFLLEWEDSVIDIREHFPLLDIQETIKEKEDLRLDLFIDKATNFPYTLTTNFLITIQDKSSNIRYIAREVKMTSDLDKKSTLERLEILRRYWQSKGVDWGIVTQKEISRVYAKNIEWVQPTIYSYQQVGLNEEDLSYMAQELIERLDNNTRPLRKNLSDFDYEFNVETGIGLFIFRFLIASKQIKINMYEPINLAKIDIQIENSNGRQKKVIM